MDQVNKYEVFDKVVALLTFARLTSSLESEYLSFLTKSFCPCSSNISCDKVTQPISELSNNKSCKYNCILIGTVFSYNFHTLKGDFSPFALQIYNSVTR